MTTNRVKKLDAALIAPGRIDYRFRFTFASLYQARYLFIIIYSQFPGEEQEGRVVPKDELKKLADKFSAYFKKSNQTLAKIQEYLLVEEDPKRARENIRCQLAEE